MTTGDLTFYLQMGVDDLSLIHIFISWEIFADSGFRPFDIGEFGIGIGPLTLCHTKTGEPGNALRFIEELQKYLRQNRKQG